MTEQPDPVELLTAIKMIIDRCAQSVEALVRAAQLCNEYSWPWHRDALHRAVGEINQVRYGLTGWSAEHLPPSVRR